MSSPTPIYQQLVEEQGDVLTDTRQVADDIRRKAEQTLGAAHGSGPAFSPAPAPEAPVRRAAPAPQGPWATGAPAPQAPAGPPPAGGPPATGPAPQPAEEAGSPE
ncbi:hypothetical protein AB0J21_20820 [Streptomyces sp. NPDC049954]|uniref:hypothetical protein n=1 Tax=Streptomyces sp. NPDC049954 TaxID=3155779 RepID=UPI00341EE42B